MLKKKLVALALGVGLMFQTLPASADIVLGEKMIGIRINDNHLYSYTDGKENRPIMVNNRVLAPLRVVSENLNSTVDWNPGANTITIDDNETKARYIFKVGQKYFTKNGTKVAIDQPPIVTQSGRTVVPIRAIAEMYGTVTWDQANYNVIIKTNRTITKVVDQQGTTKSKEEKPHVRSAFDNATYIGKGSEVLTQYLTSGDINTQNYIRSNVENKFYFIDNSAFLNLKYSKVLEYFWINSDYSANDAVYGIDDNGKLVSGVDGFGGNVIFSRLKVEDEVQKIRYIILMEMRGYDKRKYIIKVDQPIPKK